jgi:hypothetical protein
MVILNNDKINNFKDVCYKTMRGSYFTNYKPVINTKSPKLYIPPIQNNSIKIFDTIKSRNRKNCTFEKGAESLTLTSARSNLNTISDITDDKSFFNKGNSKLSNNLLFLEKAIENSLLFSTKDIFKPKEKKTIKYLILSHNNHNNHNSLTQK